MYSVFAYGRMIVDKVRVDAYARAMRQAITPGSVVLDIGTGTGFLALLACQFGARRVYAIEPSDVIEVAREVAAANGWAERIEFIQNVSTRVTLPERAEVVVSDLRGVLPLLGDHIPSIVDARRRLMTPGAALIPQRDTLWAVVVHAPELYSRYAGPWEEGTYGLDMQAARRFVVNAWRKARVGPEQLLVEPRCWAVLDYRTVDSPDVGAEWTWTAARPGTAHGLVVWFDATLVDGVCFSNAPTEPELIYGHAFFPWSRPVTLAVGDTISVALRANLVGREYVWRWDTSVRDQGDARQVKAHFKQSDLLAWPLSAAWLRKQDASYTPTPTEDAHINRLVFELIDGRTSLGDIAHRLSARFPGRFPTWQEALTYVGELSHRYGQ